MIYNYSSSRLMLGIIFQNPNILVSGKVNLLTEDFDQCLFHKILFRASVSLLNSGANTIDEVSMSNFIDNYPAEKEVLEDNKFIEFIRITKQLANAETAELHFNNIRKCTILNSYEKDGFNILPLYDESKDDLGTLDKYSVEDILNYFEGKQSNKVKKFSSNNNIEETKAGASFYEIKENFKKTPLWGKPFISDFLTTATRGMIDGQLSCFSSPTGIGKSTLMLANMTNICATELYNFETNSFEKNPQKFSTGSLYIQFELDNESEVVPKIVSYISGVETDKILSGDYTKEEDIRIDRAIEIMEESNINVVCLPNFTISSIDNLVKNQIINNNVDSIFYDYIQEGSALCGELNRSNGGVGMRTDQVLTSFASALKDMCRKYNIPLYTCTQCNANIGTHDVMDSNVISGSRSLANKLDIGCVIMPPKKKEMELVEPLLNKKGFGEHLKPTHVIHVYKSRFSAHPMNLKIFIHVNMGNGRVTDLCVTRLDGSPYKLEKTKLESV